MNNDKTRPPEVKTQTAAPGPVSPKPPPPPPTRLPPLFRRTDWLTFFITFAAVWIGYYLTLAPELTLEDSGELATGSFYAGIPHPPGYPVWTIYTWLWTVLLPVKNIAWRVALGEATGGAAAAGLLGLLVSRGSSLLMEGIEELKAIAGNWESAVCMVSGFVAGTLIGYNGFMWSQSVIVEVYAFSVLSFMIVLLCLLRWIYAPHQRRYLYLALFFHGICFTNHQTLVVAAMGIEVAIAAANYRMGRNLFLWNSIVYLAGLILKGEHILTAMDQNLAVFTIFHVVGICSILAYLVFAVLTKETFPELCLDFLQAAFILIVVSAPALGGFFTAVLGLASLGLLIWSGWQTRKLGMEWLVVVGMGFCWIAGAAFYFYMPLAGMSNPPMEWGYPRTVEGFFHALTRGQYEKTNPSDIIHDPMRFITQLGMLWTGIVEEFNWVYAFLALVPFVFFFKLHRRERAWLVGITAIYLCMGVLLLILLNPPPDRAAQELVRVFFTASHSLISLLVGYGLTLIAAFMATNYQRFRQWGIMGGAAAIALAIYSFTELNQNVYFGEGSKVNLSPLLSLVGTTFTNKDQYGLPVFAGLMLIGMAVAFVVSLLVYRNRAPLAIALVLFALMPAHSFMTHWSDNEERNHWFGYWFGHDMFTPPPFKGSDGKPLYPEMDRDSVVFGGTDPGRFCPTYMIYCDSFIPHKCLPEEDQNFDRRDCYLITQNALADNTYLCYIRAQYNRSAQIDPPFFQELVRSDREKQESYSTNSFAKLFIPADRVFINLGDNIEKNRRTYTSWFKESDFSDLAAFANQLRQQSDALSKYLYENLTQDTQKLLSGGADQNLRRNLSKDLNVLLERELVARKLKAEKDAERNALDQELEAGSTSSSKKKRRDDLAAEIEALAKVGPLYTPERFKQVELSEYITDFIAQNPQSHTRIRLNRLLLEAAYPKAIARSPGAVYPDREIITPSVEDSQRCFQEYLNDAQRRLQLNQLKPGEDVKVVDNRVQVSGQVAVMSINGLLTKVIFDKNPKSSFYVEESFPLDWMYPYLTPFSNIMKINRHPLPELTEDIVRRDHEFWSQYSERFIGNWITYDTPLTNITAFVEKTYLRHNFSGFKGDRKFMRDDQAQKAFSKLRSSIGGVYAWRISDPNNHNPVVQQRMIKEAEFAFKQAFAFCPYSPEAVFRYVNLLLTFQRLDDAMLIATTCLKLDPYNGQVIDLVNRLQTFKHQTESNPAQQNLQQLEQAVRENPTNFLAAFNLAGFYLQIQQTNRAIAVLDGVLNSPQADANILRTIAQAYIAIGNAPKLQETENKLQALADANPLNFDAEIGLVSCTRHLQQNQKAIQIIDQLLNAQGVDGNTLVQLAQECSALGDFPRLERALEKLVKASPDSAEAWYDLAAIKASLGKVQEVFPALTRSFELNAKRRSLDAKTKDLVLEAQKDPRFAQLRSVPEFQRLTATK